MHPLTTRLAKAADLPAVAALFNHYRQFYEQPDDFALAEQFIRDRMARADPTILVATAKTNVPAQALYTSLGWQRDGVFTTYTLTLQE